VNAFFARLEKESSMQPKATGLLATNLAALATSNPTLALRIEHSPTNPVLVFRETKNGVTVPVLRRSEGDLPFHSMVDPGREAERVVRSTGDGGFLVCLGLGGGFLAAAFLRQPQATGVLIVEKDLSTLKSLLENLPLSSVLSDERVRLTAGAEEIRAILRTCYLPAVAGDLITLPLRPWCKAEKEFFGTAVEELRNAAEEARADYGVQAQFGKRWFANLILNVRAAQTSLAVHIPARLAHVTAAGPSLEDCIPELGSRRDGSIIIATDTSLPALLRGGVRPEVVVSLDCQVYSYHHFLAGIPAQTTVFFDLASPPFLARRAAGQRRFFASTHPLSRFINATWRRLPLVDTTGGNVTHAAVSLARALGISEVLLHGADFSYPHAKPYARGTYLYDYFQARQQRYAPLESRLCSFVLGSAGLITERPAGAIRYSTPTLCDYGSRLEKLLSAPPYRTGLDDFEQSPPRCHWREFLGNYAEALRALPDPSAPLGAYFNRLRSEQKELWATLLPIAAGVLRETRGSISSDICLDQSRQWALDRVDRVVKDSSVSDE
jgi:hypothetical protein